MKRTLILIIAVCACLGAGTLVATSAAAPAPHGKLSSSEYKLLVTVETAVDKAVGATKIDWAAVLASCKSLGASTPLMASQQADCSANAALLDAFISFPGASAKCGKSTPKEYICMEPLYTALDADASAFYAAEVAAREKAVQRGFSGLCLETLAPSAEGLSQDKALATITDKLAADMTLIVKVLEHKAPPSALSVARVDTDVKTFEHDGDVVITRSSPSKLSVCPH